MYDVVIIGAGVCGCAVARELSRYRLKICVVEKETDVCEGTSKANSGIVHAGFDAVPGTNKARFNVAGNRMMEEMSEILDFPFKRTGALVVCNDSKESDRLMKLKKQGEENGVAGLRILSAEEAHRIEPDLAVSVCAALYAPTSGIVCPFQMTIAYAENAAVNGAEFMTGTEVTGIDKGKDGYEVLTDKGTLRTKYVVNAAGVYADRFHNMVSRDRIHITPRKGDYCLLDKNAGDHVSHTVFQLPTVMGKGVLVTPTVHGNLLVGPTARDMDDREATMTTAGEISYLKEAACRSVRDIPFDQVITSFAGLRAREDGRDFIIGEVRDAPGFIDVAGIESPGLSSAPAIGVYVKNIVVSLAHPEEKKDFTEKRKGFTGFAGLTREEQKEIIARDPSYARVICRCETVTEGEITEAIRRPVGAVSLDGIKRRTRAGMGRCQGGFCTPKVMEILSRELNVPMESICKNGPGSELITGENKDEIHGEEP